MGSEASVVEQPVSHEHPLCMMKQLPLGARPGRVFQERRKGFALPLV